MPSLKPAPTLKPKSTTLKPAPSPARRAAVRVQTDLAKQRLKVADLVARVKNERNVVLRAVLSRQLHNEFIKLKFMVAAAQGRKKPAMIVRPPAPTSQRPRTGLQTLALVRDMTSKAIVPQRATDTDPAPSTTSIPAEPEQLTEAEVQAAMIDAEAVEAAVAANAEVPAAAAAEVEQTAATPADEVVAEAAGESAGFGIDFKTVAIVAAAAAGVYFLVLKK